MTLKLYKEIMKYIIKQKELIEDFKKYHDINTKLDEHVLINLIRTNLDLLSERIEDITEED